MSKMKCTFCNKGQDEVKKLVIGPAANICNECIALCSDILAEETQPEAKPLKSRALPKPVEIKEYVDNNQSYADLAAGRIDASVNSFPNLAYAAAQRSDTFAVVTPPFGQPTYFSWVGRMSDKTLIDAINVAIIKTESDGTMEKIQKQWLGQTMSLPKTVPEPTI